MPAVVEAEAGKPGVLPHPTPGRLEPVDGEVAGEQLPGVGASRQCRAHLHHLRTAPDRSRPSLRVTEPDAGALVARVLDRIPLEVQDLREAGPGQPSAGGSRRRPGGALPGRRSSAFLRRTSSSRPKKRATGLLGLGTMLVQALSTCSPSSPHWRAVASRARRFSSAHWAALGRSVVAASNLLETRA